VTPAKKQPDIFNELMKIEMTEKEKKAEQKWKERIQKQEEFRAGLDAQLNWKNRRRS